MIKKCKCKSNIAIIGLNPEYTNEVASLVAEQLDMYFLDTLKLFEYDYAPYSLSELISENNIRWVRQKLVRTIKYACTLDNTIITFESGILNNKQKMSIIDKGCLIIYLHQEERKINKYQENVKYQTNELKRFCKIKESNIKKYISTAKEYSDITINASKFSTFKCMGEVLRAIKKYYGVE